MLGGFPPVNYSTLLHPYGLAHDKTRTSTLILFQLDPVLEASERFANNINLTGGREL